MRHARALAVVAQPSMPSTSRGLVKCPERILILRQVGPRLVSLEEAMAASGLQKSETFWDQASDTKMLLAYSQTMLICVFRGTGSWRNAQSDIQVGLLRGLCPGSLLGSGGSVQLSGQATARCPSRLGPSRHVVRLAACSGTR